MEEKVDVPHRKGCGGHRNPVCRHVVRVVGVSRENNRWNTDALQCRSCKMRIHLKYHEHIALNLFQAVAPQYSVMLRIIVDNFSAQVGRCDLQNMKEECYQK